MKNFIMFMFIILILSCNSVSHRPYCKKIIEVPTSKEDYEANEKKLLDCIEDLELYNKYIIRF